MIAVIHILFGYLYKIIHDMYHDEQCYESTDNEMQYMKTVHNRQKHFKVLSKMYNYENSITSAPR